MEAVVVADLVHQGNEAMEDEVLLAIRYGESSVLITADRADLVEDLARRIHATSAGAQSPFVQVGAPVLPVDAPVLRKAWSDLFEAAGSGTLLITAVEHMPAVVQHYLIDTLVCRQAAREPARRVRLITGTTANLHERVVAGSFSERLFYQLNIIHVIAKNGGQRAWQVLSPSP